MKVESIFPKRVMLYVNEMGVRALDRLADRFEPPAPPVAKTKGAAEGDDAQPYHNAIARLVDNWKSMSTPDKEQFVSRVAKSVVEVMAASAVLPVGLKLGKKAVKAIRKKTKKLRKVAKAAVSRKAAKTKNDGKDKKKKKKKS